MSDPAIEIAPPTARPHHLERYPIPLLRWPAQDDERRRLVARGEPRILVISQYATPPGLLDDLEVWILAGADPRDILDAMESLRHKAGDPRTRPVLDDDGLLWFNGRWVAVPDTQIPVVDLLVRNIDRLVHNEDIRTAYETAGGSAKPSTFRTLIRRVAQRITHVGLQLHVIRQRGVMLAAANPPAAPLHDRPDDTRDRRNTGIASSLEETSSG